MEVSWGSAAVRNSRHHCMACTGILPFHYFARYVPHQGAFEAVTRGGTFDFLSSEGGTSHAKARQLYKKRVTRSTSAGGPRRLLEAIEDAARMNGTDGKPASAPPKRISLFQRSKLLSEKAARKNARKDKAAQKAERKRKKHEAKVNCCLCMCCVSRYDGGWRPLCWQHTAPRRV